jgi:hypothetical protein
MVVLLGSVGGGAVEAPGNELPDDVVETDALRGEEGIPKGFDPSAYAPMPMPEVDPNAVRREDDLEDQREKAESFLGADPVSGPDLSDNSVTDEAED